MCNKQVFNRLAADRCATVHAQPLSHVRLFVTSWTVVHQASLSMGIFRQEYWNGVPFPHPRDLPCVADKCGPAADRCAAGLLAGGGGAAGGLAARLLAGRGQAGAAAGWLAAGAGLAAHWGAEEGQAGGRGAAAGGTAGGLAAALWTVVHLPGGAGAGVTGPGQADPAAVAQVTGADRQGRGSHGGGGGAGGG